VTLLHHHQEAHLLLEENLHQHQEDNLLTEDGDESKTILETDVSEKMENPLIFTFLASFK